MKIKDKLASLFEKIRSVKHIEIVIAVIAVAVMLLIYFGSSCNSTQISGIQSGNDEYDYCTEVVEELERKLSEIDGVGDATVLVSWSGPTTDDGKTFPKPEGVIIICDGGNNLSVKLKLISSVSSYFGIDENKINVLAKGNKTN